MRSLVAYYSLSGTTRKVAELAAKTIGADIVEIRTARYRRGAAGFLRAALDSLTGRLPEIDQGNLAPERYDFVLLAAPLWAGRCATPMRAYLKHHHGKFPRAAFVLTCGGHTTPRAFVTMATLAGVNPERTISLREADIAASDKLLPELGGYLASLKLMRAA